MYKMTNLSQLGSEFTVSDQNGTAIGKIQVIPHSEILEAALGPITDDFASISSYLNKSIAVLEGFDAVDPYSVLWYATEDEEIILADLIEYAVNNGYNKIILEHLDPIEE